MDADTNTGAGTSGSASVATPLPKSTTADDLLDMYAQEESQTDEGVSAEAERQARVAAEVPKKLAAEKVTKNLEAKANEADEETSSEDDLEDAPLQEKEAENEEEERQEEGLSLEEGVLKAKIGDEDIDIPAEAVLTEKLPNGKTFSFKVADAIKAMVGQEDFNRQMNHRVNTVVRREQQIQGREQNLKSEYDGIMEKAQRVARVAAQGDFIPALQSLAKMAARESGMNPVEYERAFWKSLEDARHVYLQMTPEQRERYFAERKAAEYQRVAEERGSQLERESQKQQLRAYVDNLKMKHNLSDDRFAELYETMVNEFTGEGKKFAQRGDIKPEDVIQFHLDWEHMGTVLSAVKRIAPALASDDGFLSEVFDVTKGQGFDAKSIESIVTDVLGKDSSKAVENLNRKVAEANSRGLRTQLKEVGSTNGKSSDIDEDLEEYFLKSSKNRNSVSHLYRR